MPVEIEKERKYLVDIDPDVVLRKLLPDAFTDQIILQYYLPNGYRIRQAIHPFRVEYFMDYKEPTGEKGVNIEHRTELDAYEFQQRLDFYGPDLPKVVKTRFTFFWDNHKWELDRFSNGGYILEHEYTDKPSEELPPSIRPYVVKDVTADERYTNASISKHGFPTESTHL